MTKKFAVLDSNMVVLLTVGLVDPRMIGRHKRTSAYNEADFEQLKLLIDISRGVLFCPNVASEAHNLVAHSREIKDHRYATVLRDIVFGAEERVVSAKEAVARPEYMYLGITDATLFLVAGTDGVLITGDALLHDAAGRAGLASLNLFHFKRDREGL